MSSNVDDEEETIYNDVIYKEWWFSRRVIP